MRSGVDLPVASEHFIRVLEIIFTADQMQAFVAAVTSGRRDAIWSLQVHSAA